MTVPELLKEQTRYIREQEAIFVTNHRRITVENVIEQLDDMDRLIALQLATEALYR